MQGQVTFFDEIEVSGKEELIEKIITRGTGFVDGKKRVRSLFATTTDKKERAKGLADEYRTGGSHFNGYGEDHGPKGIKMVQKTQGIKIILSWMQIERVIDQLIKEGKY